MFEARRMRGEFGCFSGKSARMTGCEAAFAEGETAAHPPAVAVHSFELLSQLSLLEASFAHASFCGQKEGAEKGALKEKRFYFFPPAADSFAAKKKK